MNVQVSGEIIGPHKGGLTLGAAEGSLFRVLAEVLTQLVELGTGTGAAWNGTDVATSS